MFVLLLFITPFDCHLIRELVEYIVSLCPVTLLLKIVSCWPSSLSQGQYSFGAVYLNVAPLNEG